MTGKRTKRYLLTEALCLAAWYPLHALLLEAADKFGNSEYERAARELGMPEGGVNCLLLLAKFHR